MPPGISIGKLQLQAHQERYFSEILSREFAKQREIVSNTIRRLLVEYRAFCLLDSRYPSLSQSDVEEFLGSELFTHINRPVFLNAAALDFKIDIAISMQALCSEMHNYIPEIIDCASFYFNNFNENLPIHPCKRLLTAFIFSTFPAIFAYCWNEEATLACITSLCQLIDRQLELTDRSTIGDSVVLSHEFRNSIMKDFVRQFYHITGVHHYLKMSLMTPLINVLNDADLSISSSPTLAHHSKILLSSLLKHIQWMPDSLKTFFRMSYDKCNSRFLYSPVEGESLMKVLFFECLIQPALMNPKLFGLFPITFVMPPSKRIAEVAKSMSAAFGLRQKLPKIGNQDYGEAEAAEIVQILSRSPIEINGIKIKALLKHFDLNSHFRLFSPSDILIIAHVVNKSIDNINCSPEAKTSLKNLCSFEGSVSFKDIAFVDFWTEHFEDLSGVEICTDTLNLPLLNVPDVDPPFDDITHVSDHLVALLQKVAITTDQPDNLSEFLERQLQKSRDTADSSLRVVILSVKTKLSSIKATEPQLLERATQIIGQRLAASNQKMSLYYVNRTMIEKLNASLLSVAELTKAQAPLIYQSLIRLFFTKNKALWEATISKTDLLISCKTEWQSSFSELSAKVVDFASVSGLSEEHHRVLTMQLHSYILKEIPLLFFTEQHRELHDKGTTFIERQDEEIALFMKQGHSESMNALLSTGVHFNSAVELLRSCTKIGAPLEIVSIVNSSLSILEKIYGFVSGDAITGDDFLPLVVFTLLKAGMPEIFSLKAYLQHFLEDETGKVLFFEHNEQYLYALFITAISVLELSS